jgi:hypothetical protein
LLAIPEGDLLLQLLVSRHYEHSEGSCISREKRSSPSD